MSHARVALLLCISLATGACAAGASNPADPPVGDDLADAFAEFRAEIERVEQHLRQSPAFGSDAERAGAYQHLTRAIMKSLEAGVLQDPDYPYFRILDFWLREGGDNPDQRYAFSPVRGGETYRIWGQLGEARRVEFQLYAGQPWAGTGRSVGYLPFESLEVADDGSFEVWLSPERPEGRGTSWLGNPPETTTVFVRHIYDDWSGAAGGDVHIDRVGYEGRRRPLETAAGLAEGIRESAAMLSKTGRWSDFVQKRYVGASPANTVRPLIDTYALGGAKGRWMGGGHFELAPGQALVIEMPATTADYQAIQLADLWFSSLEHGNLVSSLTTRQSVASPDGVYRYVIALEDPGHPNWLDTGGLRRGLFMMRYDGVQGTIPKELHPRARFVEGDAIAEELEGMTTPTSEERSRVRAERRRHLQRRSHR